MADDGFRDIQLSGKQLIALFMTAAVVLVVTFLCGVLVGRGVRAQKEPTLAAGEQAPGAAAAQDPTASVAALQTATRTSPQAQPAPPGAPPPPAEEDLSYYSRLEGQSASPESRKAAPAAKHADTPAPAQAAPRPAEAAPRATAPASPTTAAKPAATSAPKPAATAASAEPAGSGYVVKIVAYRDRAQADSLASRLSVKGYAAYVVTVSGKGAPLYSVRVGKFKARADAEAAKRRLEKEEQFKPLITR
jgi:cell division septation protein DedD